MSDLNILTDKDKLLLMSNTMSDAFYWVKVWTLIEQFRVSANNGDTLAQEFMVSFDRMVRLCEIVNPDYKVVKETPCV